MKEFTNQEINQLGGYSGRSSNDEFESDDSPRQAFVGNGFVGNAFVGADKRSEAERTKASQIHGKILDSARAGKEIPAATVTAYLQACRRTFVLETGKGMPRPLLEQVKAQLYSELADLGGKVRGNVSGLGAWTDTLAKGFGKTVGKVAEFGARSTKALVWDVPKALVWTPARATFFPGGGDGGGGNAAQQQAAVRAGGPQRAGVPAPDQLSLYANRIASQQADNSSRRQALTSRLQLAEAKKALADAEASDETALAELEVKAATAEAEAAQLEGDGVGFDWASLTNTASQARIGKAILKTSGPYAKAAIMATPGGKAALWAQQVYKEAKVDPDAPAKIAAIKQAADEGNEKAKVAMNVLAAGKQTDEELKEATLANRQLVQEDARAAGAGTVSGWLPTSNKRIPPFPGAREIHALALRGHKGASESVQRAVELLQRAHRGDEASRAQIRDLQEQANTGDAKAQADMATLAVALAGIREARAAHEMRGCLLRSKGANVGASRAKQKTAERLKNSAEPDKSLERASAAVKALVGPESPLARSVGNLFGAERYRQGLAIKLAQRH